jgi:hypothetical protein
MPAVRLIVGQAVLKGDSMDDAVRDATMMGAEAIEPLLTAHIDVKPSFAAREATVERWQRVALASAKQCRRATLPRVEAPRAFADWIQAPSAEMVLMFVEPAAEARVRPLRDVLAHAVPARAVVLLGPEGGWSSSAGCLFVSLGPLTLRAESMPVAALAAINAIWVACVGRLKPAPTQWRSAGRRRTPHRAGRAARPWRASATRAGRWGTDTTSTRLRRRGTGPRSGTADRMMSCTSEGLPRPVLRWE